MAMRNLIGDETDKLRKQVDSIFNATRTTREEMRRHRMLMEGNIWNTKEPEFQGFEKSDIQYNIIFSTIQSLVPLMTDNRPITRVNAKFPFLEKLAETLNNVTKYAW